MAGAAVSVCIVSFTDETWDLVENGQQPLQWLLRALEYDRQD